MILDPVQSVVSGIADSNAPIPGQHFRIPATGTLSSRRSDIHHTLDTYPRRNIGQCVMVGVDVETRSSHHFPFKCSLTFRPVHQLRSR